MHSDNTDPQKLLYNENFPRASKYDAMWVLENEMGPNPLWLAEALCQAMDLTPGMRVLDMGCGTALSSIFLAKEFGVQVWANDLWIAATDNWRRIQDAGVEDRVFPIHAEARSLPYAEGFFDAIVSFDSYHYYGTDDLYLAQFAKLAKPGAQIGIVVPGFMQDFGEDVPEHLQAVFHDDWHCFHTPDWWRRHWEKPNIVQVELSEAMPNGWSLWSQWEQTRDATVGPGRGSEAHILRADGGRYIGFVRMVARRMCE